MQLKHCLTAASMVLLAFASQAQQASIPITGASASSQSGNSRSAAKAIDGDTATRWEASNSSPGSWLAIEFGAPTYVDNIRVAEYGNRILGYEVHVDTGTNNGWTVWTSGQSITPEIKVGVARALKLRLYVTKAYGQPSISEIQAFTSGTANCPVYDGTPATVIQGERDCGGTTISMPGCSQNPAFRLAAGATLKNVKLISGRVQCEGSCTVKDVQWTQQPCSYSNWPYAGFTPEAPADSVLTVEGGSSYGITAHGTSVPPFGNKGTVRLRNFTFLGLRSLNYSPLTPPMSGTPPGQYWINYDLEDVKINGLTGPLVHQGRVRARRLSIVGYQPGAPVICMQYTNQGYNGPLVGSEVWNTGNCDITPADIIALPAQ